MPSKLKNNRLIPAGESCPWSKSCSQSATCNRPNAMANDFSCALARAFDMLEQRGGKGGLAQHMTVMDATITASNNPRPKAIEDIFNEAHSDEAKRPNASKQQAGRVRKRKSAKAPQL